MPCSSSTTARRKALPAQRSDSGREDSGGSGGGPAGARRASAGRLGVPAVSPDEAVAGIASLLADEPPAVVIDTTGHPGRCPAGGRIASARRAAHGRGFPDDPALIDLALLAVKELTRPRVPVLRRGRLHRGPGHIAAGRIPCRQIITIITRLEEAPARLADLSARTMQEIKILLRPGHIAS